MSGFIGRIMRYLRWKHILRCCFYLISEGKGRSTFDYEKICLIVKTDAIGDYILFRNFISAIKQSEKFKDYKIYICGNEVCKNLAEYYDKAEVHKFYWINRKKFMLDSEYRKTKLKEVQQCNPEYVIQPSFSREFLIGDSIVRAIPGKCKIGAKGDNANDPGIFTILANGFYSKIYSIDPKLIFEFDRNKEFVEQIIEEPIHFNAPFIETNKSPKGDYVVLFPGAGEIIKQWPAKQFAVVAKYIYEKYRRPIIICGSPADKVMGETILTLSRIDKIQNMCGETNLVRLTEIIQKAALLITNDSSAFHLGACTQTETIGLFMGRHYGRFAPYTDDSTHHLHYIYPSSFEKLLQTEGDKMIKRTKYQSPSSIEEITVEQVTSEVDFILGHQ